MPKYLLQASYTSEGARGLLAEGGSKRRAAVEKLVGEIGGRIEAFYFAFGETDVFVIIDGPDNVAAAAGALSVNASGVAHLRTTVLVTPEEMDQACQRSVSYRAPGHA